VVSPVIKSKADGVHTAPVQIFSSLLFSMIPSRFFAGVAIFAGLTSFLSSSINAQTVLAQGDIAFVQYDADNPDKFTFVNLVDLAAGTVINFTDCGFASATTGTTTEGFLTFTVPVGTTYLKGTTFTWTNGMVVTGTPWSSAAPTNFAFNSSGDQLFAFQGSTSNWATQSGITLIAGLIQRTTWLTTGAAAAATSYQPSALSSAYITSLATENGYFANGTATSTSVVVSNTKAQLQSLLFDGTNKWYNNATGPLAAPTFSISLGSVPVITGAATASALTTTYGTASSPQSFSISGSNLTADLVATAPTGFEVSADGTSYGGTATFSQSSGTASGSLRVRLKANAAVSGSYNGQNIVLSSTGATSVNIVTAATGNAVTVKGLTITANDQTVNAGSALANVPASSNFTSSGLANGETIGTVSLNYGGAGAVAGTFPIVPSGATGGTFTAANYIISYVNGTLTVSSAPVPTIAYGGETLPALSTTYPSASSSTSFTISGVNMAEGIIATAPIGFEVSTDNTTFTSSVTVGASGTIGSTTVYVRLAGSTSAGTKTGSVSLTSSGATAVNVAVTSSTVQAKSITGSFAAANKAYDANTSATVTARSLDGVVGSDAVTLSGGTATFDTAGAGTGKTVILSGAALSGIAASNYTLASVSTTTADITQADQTITFEALSAVSVTSAPFTLSGTASSGLAVTYASSNPAVATVSVNTITIVGPGTCNITASQLGNGNYKAASVVVRSLVVNELGSVGFDGNTYTQNFESMTSSTTAASVTASTMTEVSSLTGGGSVNGWYIYGSGWTGAASKWVGSDTGSSNSGGFRQLIDGASPVGRALGSQGSGSAAGFFGVVLKNTSGRTIDKVDISYDAVMNRNPSSNANNYPMSYMVSATGVAGNAGSTGVGTFNKSAGTWLDGVGFSTPTTGTGAPNATQAAITPLFKIGGASITQKLTGLNWPANGYLYIRWQETDETGSDADAGIDNFTISAVSPTPTISNISPTSVFRGSGNTPVTFTGTGYSSSETTVSIGGNSLSLTNVTSTSLTANVTSNYFTTAGTLAMTLSNPAPGGGSVSTNLAVVTPLPTIAGLSPASVVAGAGDTLLTVSGTGFFGESVVRWNGTDLVTSYNSPNQLTATIPAVNLSTMVVASVTVATPDVGGLFQESVVTIFQVTSPTVPQVTPSVGTLSGFETPVGTPSAEKSYTLQGQYLSSNVVLTAPPQFQISKTSGSGFGSSLDIPAEEVVAGVTIYVRYNPSAASSSHLGSISHVSDGAVTQNVAVTGNSQPTLSVNPASVSIFDYQYVAGDNSGNNGDTPSFLVSGNRLASVVTVTAPRNYGVSSDGVTFTSSVNLTPDSTGIVYIPVYVRFQPLSAVAADESITITVGSLSATVTANGKATALTDNKSLSDQARDGRVTLSWSSSGAGYKVVVLANLGSALTDVPSNLSSLTASSVYGQGTLVGSSYVVYKEDQLPGELTPTEKLTITGLTNGQQYTFKVFVVSGDAVSAGTSVKSIPFADLSNVLTQWTFNSSPADAQTATGTLSPSTGTGTAGVIGSSTSAAYTGGSASDPLGSAGADNSALTYTGPQSGTVPNKSAGVQIAVSTVGRKNIVIYWDNRASNAGPKHLRAQYTLDVTAATPVWVDYVATSDGLNVANGGLYEAQAGDTWYIRRKADLSGVTGVANNAKFGFRLVASYAPGESGYRKADGTSTTALAYFAGNFRTDMLTVTGVGEVLNSAPTQIGLSAAAIAENSVVNTVVGTLSTTDADSGDTFTYSLVAGTGDTDNASFNISGASLRASAAFDFETKSSYSIRVRTTDSGGATFEKVLAITVTNVSDTVAEDRLNWLLESGLSPAPNLNWNSDPNNVGYTISYAYAFGLSAIVNSGAPITIASSPAGSVKIVYMQRNSISGIIYTVKSGTDLAAGLNGTVTPVVSAVQPSPGKLGYTQYEATYTPSAPATKGFLKVEAFVP